MGIRIRTIEKEKEKRFQITFEPIDTSSLEDFTKELQLSLLSTPKITMTRSM